MCFRIIRFYLLLFGSVILVSSNVKAGDRIHIDEDKSIRFSAQVSLPEELDDTNISVKLPVEPRIAEEKSFSSVIVPAIFSDYSVEPFTSVQASMGLMEDICESFESLQISTVDAETTCESYESVWMKPYVTGLFEEPYISVEMSISGFETPLISLSSVHIEEQNSEDLIDAFTSPIFSCVTPASIIEYNNEWFNRYGATVGSHVWWLLRSAEEAYDRGEPTDQIKEQIDVIMNEWVVDDDVYEGYDGLSYEE